jgi:hypothetical protein
LHLNLLLLVVVAELLMENEDQMPSLKIFFELRYIKATGLLNQDYLFFCEKLLKPAVGANKFNNGVKIKMLSVVASVHDEAFALLLLVKNYGDWFKEFRAREAAGEQLAAAFASATAQPVQQQQKKKRSYLPRSPFTSGMKRSDGQSAARMTSRNQGWSYEAIMQFNFFVSMVDDDRQKHSASFDAAFSTYMKCKQGIVVDQAAPAAKRYKPVNGIMSKQQMMESMAEQQIDAVVCKEKLDELIAKTMEEV